MNFPKTTLVYFVTIFSFAYTVSSEKFAECKSCRPRDFPITKSEACYCPGKKFCNETTGICNRCGEHFDFWNDGIRKLKENIERSLDQLVKNYEINLKHLQRNMTVFFEKSKRQEKQLENLSTLTYKVNKDIASVLSNIENIQGNLNTMKGKLKTISMPSNLKDIPKYLESVVTNINDLLNMIQKIKDEYIADKNKILNIKTKLSEMNRYIHRATEKFPEMLSNYLNLNFETESDLNILEAILSLNYSFIQHKLINTLEDKIKWIKLDIINLIDIIKQFPYNSIVHYEELINNTLHIRVSANATRSRLQTLLQEQEDFRQLLLLLKEERKYYYTIRQVTDRLEAVNESIMNIGDLKAFYKLWNDAKALDRELNVYETELQTFRNKLKTIKGYESKMNEVLNEQSELLKIFEETKSILPVGDIKNEVKQMLNEVKIITNEINFHCNSNEMQNKTNTEQNTK